MSNITYKKISCFSDEIAPNLDKQIEVLVDLNISYIEIRNIDGKNISDFTVNEAKNLKEILDKNNIKVSAIGSPIGKINIRDDFETHLDKYKNVLEIAKILETQYIRIFSFFIDEGENPEEYKNEVFSRTRKLIELAKENNIVLLHENEKDIYGDNIERCLSLMQEFYGPNYKLTFDFANFIQCKQDPSVAYDTLKDYVEYVHIKDAIMESGNVVPAGEGDGNLKEIIKLLFENKYSGFLSLEPHLSNFVGFQSLELNDREMKFENSVEAFYYAYESLSKIT